MTKEDFEGKLNALVPQPDPEITAALFAFGGNVLRVPPRSPLHPR